MSSPALATVKHLFAVSGNACAFPKCQVPLVDRVSSKVTGRICHIKANSPAGPRYDPSQTEEERHSFENLLLLCPLHHDIVDADAEAYSVERLTKMKQEHESKTAGAGDLTDTLAEELIRVSDFTITSGSVVVSTGQSGGQVAHMIANYLASEPGGRPSWSAKLREKEADILVDAWDKFQEAYGHVWGVVSPLQQFADLSKMSEAQFEEFLAASGLPEFRKAELRSSPNRTKSYQDINFWQKFTIAREKQIAFHNFIVKNRILIDDNIKSAFVELDSAMSDALIKLEIGKDYDVKMRFEASQLIRSMEAKVIALEAIIYKHIHGE